MVFDGDSLSVLPRDKRAALEGVLANDPRPRYHSDAERVYGMSFAGFQVKFTVNEGTLTVLSIEAQK